MSTSQECCGWLGWAEMAGIGVDGRRLDPTASTSPAGPAATTAATAPDAVSPPRVERARANTYDSTIVRRELVAVDTLACYVTRPAGFEFRPGQYVDITLLRPPFDDRQGATRSMSIANGPDEADLLMLMRLRDTAFKRSIMALPIGAPVLLDGPADDLAIRHDDGRRIVMIAGGVGVAPFRAMLRGISLDRHRDLTRRALLDATLFYSNRRPEDAAYLGELMGLEAQLDGLRVVPTMTRMSTSRLDWSGERERLSATMLARHLGELSGPRYYISGSTLFISGLCQELERAGVPGGDIRIEMYTGY